MSFSVKCLTIDNLVLKETTIHGQKLWVFRVLQNVRFSGTDS